MNTEVSTPIKIFAAVGLVLALGLGGMMLMKGGGSSSSAAPIVTPTPTPAATTTPGATTPTPAPATHTTRAPAKPAAHLVTPAPAHSTPATRPHAAPAAPAKPATHAAPQTHAKPHKPAKRVHVPAVAANGLPTPLDMLLHIHQVVVVAVYDPEIPTDKFFVEEARAGAKDARAGFLAVSVLNEKVAAPLTAAAGKGALLPSPGLLIYKQPTLLMNVLTGFVDRAAVTDAVANALVAEAPAQPSTPAATGTTP